MGAIGWLRSIVVDADDYRALAEFWRALFDVEVAEEVEDWIQLAPDSGGGSMAFQPAPTGRAPATIRARPDIEVADIEVARARVLELGGSEIREVHEPGGDWHVIMADPEGNQFCIVSPFPSEIAALWAVREALPPT